jgi:hypothetical protein
VAALGGLEVGLEAGRAPGRAAPTSRRRRRHTRAPAPATPLAGRGKAPPPRSLPRMLTTRAQSSRASAAAIRRRATRRVRVRVLGAVRLGSMRCDATGRRFVDLG